MTPQRIDLESWVRRPWFDHYFHRHPCTYAITAELDVSELERQIKRVGARTYPAHVWAVSTAINRHQEFRMTLADSGDPAVWPHVDPAFTIFHASTETFSSLWVPYLDDFRAFQDSMAATIEKYRDSRELLPQPDRPGNTFDLSAVPWATFTGFTLNIQGGYQHLAPIVTLGRSVLREGRSTMPIAVQVHHAAADGFHVARLINEIQDLFNSPDWLAPDPG